MSTKIVWEQLVEDERVAVSAAWDTYALSLLPLRWNSELGDWETVDVETSKRVLARMFLAINWSQSSDALFERLRAVLE